MLFHAEASQSGGAPGSEERAVTAAECLALSAAVAEWRHGRGQRLSEALGEAFSGASLSAGAVAAWLTRRSARQVEGESILAAEAAAMLDELGRDLRVTALPATRCPEVGLLVATLQLAREHLELETQFEERLADGRLEAVRQLAYGAGHEINNPLANIATRGQSLLRDEPDPERRRKLATIVDQAFRARDMIGGLMVFAKPPVATPARVDLGSLAESVLGSLSDQVAADGVELVSSVPAEPVWASVDPRLVAEALLALLVNAAEAIAAGGQIRLRVLPSVRAGVHAVVVGDTGPGMDAAEQAVACDPFHCGREAGRGLGVGLSKAWALAKACGGRLVLGGSDATGASVRIELPADRGEAAARPAAVLPSG